MCLKSSRAQISTNEYTIGSPMAANDSGPQRVVASKLTQGTIQILIEDQKKLHTMQAPLTANVKDAVFCHLKFASDSQAEIHTEAVGCIGDALTFDEAGLRDGAHLHIVTAKPPTERHVTRICGPGSLGLKMSVDENDGNKGGVRVIAVSGPAEAAGLTTHDRIIVVNGQDVQNSSFEEVQDLFCQLLADRDQIARLGDWQGVELAVDRPLVATE